MQPAKVAAHRQHHCCSLDASAACPCEFACEFSLSRLCFPVQVVNVKLSKGLIGLWNYSEQGSRYVRDFSIASLWNYPSQGGQGWRNPNAVAMKHIHEKFELLRLLVAFGVEHCPSDCTLDMLVLHLLKFWVCSVSASV